MRALLGYIVIGGKGYELEVTPTGRCEAEPHGGGVDLTFTYTQGGRFTIQVLPGRIVIFRDVVSGRNLVGVEHLQCGDDLKFGNELGRTTLIEFGERRVSENSPTAKESAK